MNDYDKMTDRLTEFAIVCTIVSAICFIAAGIGYLIENL